MIGLDLNRDSKISENIKAPKIPSGGVEVTR